MCSVIVCAVFGYIQCDLNELQLSFAYVTMQIGGKTVALKSFKLIVKIDKFKIFILSHRKFSGESRVQNEKLQQRFDSLELSIRYVYLRNYTTD